ncbi:Rhythmically expressed gene 5 protein [Frankliniella fusca]|uniref:Rhythmically expressed gene 5 protein n=1 Tax=Frankliniella fusca TaxID=407009 RepID=A0AAE1HIF8_9NEOP|nr:Rhythmically expressed gene 5 protein [Frankliniella fusca]
MLVRFVDPFRQILEIREHCARRPAPEVVGDCNKVLMVYGLTNLAKMDDDSLDKMDPYQRGAQDIIWDSMMKGGYKSPANASPTPSAATSTSPSRRNEGQDVYEDDGELTDGGNSLGGPGSGSAPQAQDHEDRFVLGHAGGGGGPMVVRVMPDGSPVPGDSERLLPRDEDAEEFRLMRGHPMPSLEELQRGRGPQHQPRHRAPASGIAAPDHDRDRYQPSPAGHFSRLVSASQPHAKFALPPPGMNFRIAARPHSQ